MLDAERDSFNINPKEFETFDELEEVLFWSDRYIIDDGQYIMDYNKGILYEQDAHFFRTVLDRFKTGEPFDMIQTDADIQEEILEAQEF